MYIILIFLSVVILLGAFWIKKLKTQIKEYEIFIDEMPFFVDSFDKNGKCTLWNKECERVFGWSKEEINNASNSLELFYPDKDDQEKTMKLFSEAIQAQFIECYPRTKDGELILSKWSVIYLPSGNNIIIGYNINEENSHNHSREKTLQMNESKQKLAELSISLEQKFKAEIEKNYTHQKLMLQQSRHAQMGEIISMIAHQWRHPLNNLSLIIQDAIFQYKVKKFDNDVIQRLDKESSKQIQEMSKIITGFKNFFRPEKEKIHFNISQAIKDALHIVEAVLKAEKINVDVDIIKDVDIIGFPTELGQSIVNIMLNAKDALIEKQIKDKQISLKLLVEKEYVNIIIEDNARGIDPDIIERIFDPYVSTKADKQGTGLGLYITKIIIEDHMQGLISVNSDSKGSVFNIKLYRP